ncbi:MAG: hypothetical protein NWE95_09710 [Candidatus Bathyarchaeota archaeon]|nr:hypothetical protein [Candidatus Bathyarchaeota archaeon]
MADFLKLVDDGVVSLTLLQAGLEVNFLLAFAPATGWRLVEADSTSITKTNIRQLGRVIFFYSPPYLTLNTCLVFKGRIERVLFSLFNSSQQSPQPIMLLALKNLSQSYLVKGLWP